jgi:hypothetical protein
MEIPRIILCTLVCGALASPLQAQYYEGHEYPRSEARYLAGGVVWRTFDPRATNTIPDSLVTSFRRLMPMLAFRQGPVDLYFGYMTFREHEQSRQAIVFGTQVASDLLVSGSRSGALLLPLMLAADFSKVETGGPQRDDFNLGSIGLGVGLKFRSVSPSAEFWVQGVQLFHFSFEGVAAGTGSSLATIGEITLLLPRIPVGEGLVFTYRVRLQTWAMNDAQFNFRSLYHGPSIGLMF